MTPDQFTSWLKGQQSLGYTIDDIAAGLCVDSVTLYRWKKKGTSGHTDLAILAYDAGLPVRDAILPWE